ncbi:tRNA (adenosine(37)-N6)-threonylcarbamoyltransferase complex dimerization subunit type 1 TsaB [Exilibacterium tricleocarpae]|uniref:tRNA threonylcarbamoyladenosine biosynthesis protein TsaB n=1 Tax=Exilibacterium tricleocarpae TaxID=2591008 RepID=A0A545U3U7_9GAMM|nr:tRNA (adenosine(37)-N6)-threonylcarbamoyltransferase complex dimerization subunit type 1 TsaB [Exilibacterium tricleocarpae]TQV84104.1 tRNA (adenosine(37)-N6)-threonylcarbamoyltransferase complex dimerization subunit type 1 TsaB [Exilibacterium tricleocarpae]
MSKILALDTSTDACSVALYLEGEIIEDFQRAPRQHTQRLLPAVDGLLSQQKLRLRDIDAIAFGCGPGSFTGLRICMSTVQGLAFGTDLPVIPVSTLLALVAGARRRRQLPASCSVMAALDARMEQIYWGLFTVDGAGVVPNSAEFVSAPDALDQREDLVSLRGQLVGVGSGWCYPGLSCLAPAQVLTDADCHAGDIAELGAACFLRGETVPVLEAQPVYLRDEVTWQKRQRLRERRAD